MDEESETQTLKRIYSEEKESNNRCDWKTNLKNTLFELNRSCRRKLYEIIFVFGYLCVATGILSVFDSNFDGI